MIPLSDNDRSMIPSSRPFAGFTGTDAYWPQSDMPEDCVYTAKNSTVDMPEAQILAQHVKNKAVHARTLIFSHASTCRLFLGQQEKEEYQQVSRSITSSFRFASQGFGTRRIVPRCAASPLLWRRFHSSLHLPGPNDGCP